MISRLGLFLCLSIFCTHPYAQQYHFISYNVDEGLPQTQVFDVAQDEKGFLWVATIGGVGRFDGQQFENFTARDGLYKNQSRCLAFDTSGKLWVGSDGGYSVISGKELVSYALPDRYVNEQINSILPVEDGKVWVATNGAGALLIHKNRLVTAIDSTAGLPDPTVRCILYNREGSILLATRSGLWEYREGKLKNFLPESFAEMNASHLLKDKYNRIWVSTFGDGVYCVYPDGDIEHFNEDDGLLTNWVRGTLEGTNGSIWFITRMGLTEIFKGKTTSITTFNGLPYDNIRSGLCDREGNFWFGTDGKGLLKFSGKALITYTVRDGMADDLIMSVVQSKSGSLYFSSLQAGIVIQGKAGSFSKIDIASGLPHNTVWCSTRDLRGNLWFGTSMGLVKIIDTTVVKVYQQGATGDSLPDSRVTSLFCDNQGNIWAGTRLGVSVISPTGKFRRYTSREGFAGQHIRAITQDKEGRLWLGAENGVYMYDGTFFQSMPVIPDNQRGTKIYSLTTDYNGSIWIGTENGLYTNALNSKFQYIPLGNDSRTDFINFILSDSDSSIWIGTNYGVFNIDLPGMYHGRTVIKSLTHHEGIANLECNLNAAYQDVNGNCWFGTGGGLIKLQREYKDELENSRPPDIILRQILLLRTLTDLGRYSEGINSNTGLPRKLKLPWNKNQLSFQFTAISFRNPDFLKFQYKMDGYDEDWSPVGAYREAVYSLPPGEYTFRIRAANSAGIWTPDDYVYSFVITPPFWLTWWFYVIIGMFVAAIAYSLATWRIRVLKRKEKTKQLLYQSRLMELEQQSLNASMNRHFIFNALNSIQYYINRQDKLSANRYLTSFAKLIRKNLDSSTGKGTVSLAEEIERLELYLGLEYMRFTDKFTYDICVDPELDTENIEVPAMMLQPFVENSIWHGILPMNQSGHIQVDLLMKDGKLLISITDNGIGIDVSKISKSGSAHQHSSRGMKITTGRIELLQKMSRRTIILKGPFQVSDENGNSIGTRVEIIMEVEK